jgi:hypothetical protein
MRDGGISKTHSVDTSHPWERAGPTAAKQRKHMHISSEGQEHNFNQSWGDHWPSVVIRKLPLSTTAEALRALLLFSGQTIDAEFVIDSAGSENSGYLAAIVRFATFAGAQEACDRLDGKYLSSETNISVEMVYQTIESPRGEHN